MTKINNENKKLLPVVVIDSEKFQELINQVSALIAQNQQEKPSDLFTVESLADYLQTTSQTIYRYVSARKIPFIKIGKFIRFRKADIDLWLSTELRTNKKEGKHV